MEVLFWLLQVFQRNRKKGCWVRGRMGKKVWEFGRTECVALLFWKVGYLLTARQHKEATCFLWSCI